MQETTVNTSAQIAANASMPILLAEIYLVAGTLRFAATRSNVTFPTGGSVYTAKGFQYNEIETSLEGQITELDIAFDNVLQDMHGYNAVERFDGKKLIIKKVYNGDLTSGSNYREIFNGFMQEPYEIGKQWLKVKAVRGKPFQRRMLQQYFQRQCVHLFGDAKCNYNGYANLNTLKATGTADSGTAQTLRDNALNQTNDYWNFGRIEITVSGVKYYRKILDFDASIDTLTFDVPLPIAVVAGMAYTVYKGCSLTLDACKRTYAYGPAMNNSENFKGFIHIGDFS
jgi:hypothetical protein